MVIQELGAKILEAINKLQSAKTINEEVVDAVIKGITTALLQGDVNFRQVYKLKENVKKEIEKILQNSNSESTSNFIKSKIHNCVIDQLIELVTPASTEPKFSLKKNSCSVIMMVGLQGAGKTTTCTKLGFYYKRKGWRVALVCADTFRAGAFDQLKQNATRCKIPFYGSYTDVDAVSVARQGVELFKKEATDLIIVDTSGRHKNEEDLFDEMKQIEEAIKPDQILFVMDSHIGQSCGAQAEAFSKAVRVGAVIITKLDGHAKGGGALSAVAATGAPIIFSGTGEHFDQFEQFEPKSYVCRLLNMGDPEKFFAKFQEAMPASKQPELAEKIIKGQFTLRDMGEQLQNILSMGPLDQLMGMIPVLNNMMPAGGSEEGAQRLKKFLFMLDSMTESEKDMCTSPDDSRIIRIARGSGCQIWEVKMMLYQYEQMSRMMSGMGKMMSGKSKGVKPQIPNSIKQQLNPDMMKQLMNGNMPQGFNLPPGGLESLANSMGGFAGGMPDLSAIMGGKKQIVKKIRK